jgi:hypothetical protein
MVPQTSLNRQDSEFHGSSWFAKPYENGRETFVANRVSKPLKLLSPCSPLGSASNFNNLGHNKISQR